MNPVGAIRRALAMLCALLVLLGLGDVPAGAASLTAARGIAVLYPEVAEPYRSVFAKIVEGIEDQAKGRVASFEIGPNQSPQNIMIELRRQDIRVVIALGRNGLRLASGLDRDIGLVAGAMVSVPETQARSITLFSLAPSPALMFSRLQSLMPNARRVFVVYDPAQNGWLIRLAKEAARARGLELVAYEAADLKTALRIYREILAAADAKKDALWLPQDSNTVDDTLVLPLVLQEAWSRDLTFFSSSVAHVRRGALFSLYPNNLEMGRNLAHSSLGLLASGTVGASGVLPLTDVLMAVNVRTADHLGINISRMQQSFDLVFPEP